MTCYTLTDYIIWIVLLIYLFIHGILLYMGLFILSRYIISTTLIIFLLIDAVLLYVVKRYGNLISNNYFNIHKKYGFLKIQIIKLMISAFLIYGLHHASGKSGATLSFTVLFCIYVAFLLRDFINQKKKAR